ncbi:uncharacterized protein LOC133722017 isoform X1 [Rosa rugosa]|uniref:uncharacterized protein LOC133722017 isoform X1 n=1 Tax=Rosa rugosa TaxID=74645 RepID=UPI002B410FA4|nr:uncharacterized protein LOC133722017 isoform X1 [Rosa rugosa]
MANVLRSSALRAPLAPLPTAVSPNSPKPFFVSFRRQRHPILRFSHLPSLRLLVPFASHNQQGETDATDTLDAQDLEEDSLDGAVSVEDSTSDAEESGTSDDGEGDDKKPVSAIIASLQLYKEALASNDESKVAEIESFLKSVEDEKIDLERKVASLSEELSAEKVRILRISADFDNFRKRTDRERISLVTNAQGEVVESLLGVLDNFERAKTQIKVETEGEEKINNSYQSIYKQFGEILSSLGVLPVETVGKPFDPLLHEAIMREESSEFEEGIILDEFRKGFKLGDRLLRPSMVKVSAGPGPAKPEQQVAPSEEHDASEATKEDSTETESA